MIKVMCECGMVANINKRTSSSFIPAQLYQGASADLVCAECKRFLFSVLVKAKKAGG